MSRYQSDEICDLWDNDPRQVTEEEAIHHTLHTIQEHERRLKMFRRQLNKIENLIKMLLEALKAQEVEHQALRKALIAQEKLTELQIEESSIETDLSLIEFQEMVQHQLEQVETENLQLRAQLETQQKLIETMQARLDDSENMVLEFTVPINPGDHQTITLNLFWKGGHQDDKAEV